MRENSGTMDGSRASSTAPAVADETSAPRRQDSSSKEQRRSLHLDNLRGDFDAAFAGAKPSSADSVSSMSTLRGADTRSLRPEPATPARAPLASPAAASSSSGDIASGTPLATPGVHHPFTTLSPTVTPNLAKLAKHRISQDFRASAHRSTFHVDLHSAHSTSRASTQTYGLRLNPLDVAVSLQSEVGLGGWWDKLTQLLYDSFEAERVTLAVPTDSTDVENVPWAQLATFRIEGEDDDLSRITNDAQSSRSNLTDVPSVASSTAARATPRSSGSTGGNNLAARSERPGLLSRHSYSGYPVRQKSEGGSEKQQEVRASNYPGILASPTAAASSHSLDSFSDVADLREKAGNGRAEASEDENRIRITEDMYAVPEKPLFGRVLNPVQPLESEADPLLTTAGVVKVLRQGAAVVLTREYFAPEEEASERLSSKPKSELGSKAMPSPKPGKPKHSSASKRHHGDHKHRSRKSTKDERASGNPRAVATPAYEDYEQNPGTPWAQSPAPSPAAQADEDENPFFTDARPDQSAFAEVPEHSYFPGPGIPAIGLDHSRSIIQLPIYHPNARGHPHQQTPGIESRSGKRTVRFRTHHLKKSSTSAGDNESYLSSENGSANTFVHRPVPLAILSVLAPKAPYPPELLQVLKELSPLIATTFHTSRIYSNLSIELAALRGRRHPHSISLDLPHGDMDFSNNMAALSRSTFMSEAHDLQFSPASPYSSQASAGGESTSPQSYQTTRSPYETGSIGATLDGTSREPSYSKSGQRTPAKSPGVRSHGKDGKDSRLDYFSPLRSPASREGSEAKSSSKSKSHSKTKSKSLHSKGASFSHTQPSLPEGHAAETTAAEGGGPYGEPTGAVLRAMIDNGATQQFIAEARTGKLVWANSKFISYRGAPPGVSIDDQFWNYIHQKDFKEFRNMWRFALETGEQFSKEVRIKRFNGDSRYYQISFLPLKDKYGVIRYWHGQAMDIHDQWMANKQAMKSQNKASSEAKYRALANSLPVIVFAASVYEGVTFANTHWQSYSGQSIQEASNFGFLEHVHPEDLKKCRFPGIDALAQITKGQMGRLGSNARMPLKRSASSFSSTTESEDAQGRDADTSPDEAGASGPEGELNNELLRGLARDGIILCSRNEQGNLSITTEMRLKNRKNEYRWHLVQGSYIDSVDFGRGEAQWFIACTDISNQKSNEEKIQKANSALENLNISLEKEMKQKMGYLSSMSHEIRTPLNGIIGNLQFLINCGLEEAAGEWAHGAQEAAKNMHDLINDILDLSKAEANMLRLAYHWFSPRALMDQVVDMLGSKASERKIELSTECSDLVPRTLRGDAGRIRQVLVNLVGNAIKFTKVGEVSVACDVIEGMPPTPTIPAHDEQKGAESIPAHQLPLAANEVFVKWSVRDTGLGFSEADKALLFKPYSQIQNKSTRDAGGTGLGLILCKTMVTLHGGDITAESTPGHGAEFSFWARFKIRKDSARHGESRVGSVSSAAQVMAASSPNPLYRLHSSDSMIRSPAQEPMLTPEVTAAAAKESPAMLSDSSSALSVASGVNNQKSLRSSMSTIESTAANMKLTLPNSDVSLPTSHARSLSAADGAAGSGGESDTSQTMVRNRFSPPQLPKENISPLVSPRTLDPRISMSDFGGAVFSPSMLSILLVCPPENARRITSEQIRDVAPKSAPCNIVAEGSVDAALDMLFGPDAVTFTHVVLRITSDADVRRIVSRMLAADSIKSPSSASSSSQPRTPLHQHHPHRGSHSRRQGSRDELPPPAPPSPPHQPLIVFITDQAQIKSLARANPPLDFDELRAAGATSSSSGNNAAATQTTQQQQQQQQAERVHVVQKPVAAKKLARIFDPLGENAAAGAEDPREAKRREEKRLQQESYALFKRELGGKGVRVLAVEDNILQMRILYNFLAKICFLDVVKAGNGKECFDLYREKPVGYFSVIVTDIEMPVMDGLTMCRRIRELERRDARPPIPVVSLSANTLDQGWLQCADAGFTHYCGKPVNFRDLGAILVELTDARVPHRFLRDRPKPKALLRRLGLLPERRRGEGEEVVVKGGGGEVDEDDDEDESDSEEEREY